MSFLVDKAKVVLHETRNRASTFGVFVTNNVIKAKLMAENVYLKERIRLRQQRFGQEIYPFFDENNKEMLRKTLDTAKEVISLWQLEIQHNLQTIAELDTGSTLPSTMISKETEQSKPDSNVVAKPDLEVSAEPPKASFYMPTEQDFLADVAVTSYSDRSHLAKLLTPIAQEGSLRRLELEYQYITKVTPGGSSEVPKPETFPTAFAAVNFSKNRFINILPFEETRVKLTNNGTDGSDYINANWIDGYKPSFKFVATQGPLESTIPDFWRMTWELNSSVIVMLTKFIEKGSLKCAFYFPEKVGDTKDLPNGLSVHLKTETADPNTVIREIVLTFNGVPRTIWHFHSILWPDYGLPASSAGFLELVRLADEKNPKENPIIVHCSAGVGRSGTFCTIHTAISQIKSGASSVNIPKILIQMRKQRPGMVQTSEQYEFTHLALAEYLGARK